MLDFKPGQFVIIKEKQIGILQRISKTSNPEEPLYIVAVPSGDSFTHLFLTRDEITSYDVSLHSQNFPIT